MNDNLNGKNENRGFYIFSIIFMFSLTFMVVYRLMMNAGPDYCWHAYTAVSMTLSNLVESVKSNPYPLWHAGVSISYHLFKIPLEYAAAIVTAVIYTVTYILVYQYYKVDLKNYYDNNKMALYAIFLLLLGPIYVPWFNSWQYLGQGTPNTWHNPTNPTVRPFAIICFFLLVVLFQKWKDTKTISKKEYVAFMICLAMANLAKPSFIQMFIPGVALYMLFDLVQSKGKNFVFLFKIACAFIPSVIVIGIQYLLVFSSETGKGISVSWLEVLHLYTPNVLVSFLLAFAFPLYALVIDWKENSKRTDVILVICLEISGWLESALLRETGDRISDGNFLWGSYLSMFLVWMVMTNRFFVYRKTTEQKHSQLKIDIGLGLFFIHVIFGVLYVGKFLFVENFWL